MNDSKNACRRPVMSKLVGSDHVSSRQPHKDGVKSLRALEVAPEPNESVGVRAGTHDARSAPCYVCDHATRSIREITSHRASVQRSGATPLFASMVSPTVEVRHETTVSVIIPTLNEARNLPYVLPRVPEWVHEVVLVDGHSTDDTVDVAMRLLPTVRVLQQHGHGKGAALRTGFAAATGDIIVMLDADGSMDPAEIPAYVGLLLAGADFVKGTRFAQGGGTSDMSILRQSGNWGLTQLVRVLFGGRFTDLCYGYAAFWRQVLPILSLNTDGFEIETEMNLRALGGGLHVAEVPSFEAERIHGQSNLRTFVDGWKVLKTITREAIAGPRRRLFSSPKTANTAKTARINKETERDKTGSAYMTGPSADL